MQKTQHFPLSPRRRSAAKRRSTGRIDGVIALTMALGVAPLRTAVKFDVEALIA